MRKIILTLALILTTCLGFSQEEMQESQVPIDLSFNKSLFPMAEGNMFMSSEPVAFIMANVMPQSYEDSKLEMEAMGDDPELTNVKKGELTDNGKKFLYQTAVIKNDEGGNLVMEIYIVKVDETSTIMVSGGYDVAATETFKNEIKKAALSAKVAQ